MKYYFLGSALPLLSFKNKSDLSYQDFSLLMEWNLQPKDKEVVKAFKTYIDLKNLKQLWLKMPVDPRGNLDDKSLNEALFTKDNLPDYVFDFTDKFASGEDRIKHFRWILVEFFKRQKAEPKSRFLRFYFDMEHDIAVITTMLRARLLQKDLEEEFVYEDKTDLLVKTLLEQKGQGHVNLDPEKMKIAELFEKNYQNPEKLNLAFLEYRFQRISTAAEKNPFSIDQILGYLAAIMLIEDLFRLNESSGKLILDKLLR